MLKISFLRLFQMSISVDSMLLMRQRACEVTIAGLLHWLKIRLLRNSALPTF